MGEGTSKGTQNDIFDSANDDSDVDKEYFPESSTKSGRFVCYYRS